MVSGVHYRVQIMICHRIKYGSRFRFPHSIERDTHNQAIRSIDRQTGGRREIGRSAIDRWTDKQTDRQTGERQQQGQGWAIDIMTGSATEQRVKRLMQWRPMLRGGKRLSQGQERKSQTRDVRPRFSTSRDS